MPPEPVKLTGAAPKDPWARLRASTTARIGLARTGDAMALHDVLAFQLAHARARDAVHAPLDVAALVAKLPGALVVHSEAPDRATYLRRPDLGRRLAPGCTLARGDADAVFVIADGLSAAAVAAHAVAVMDATTARLPGFTFAPPVIATQARVAIGDDIAAALGARLAVVLIGERPGLSVAESLGVYLTYAPVRGVRDSARNCISNIHTDGGLSYEGAANLLSWLMREALQRKLTGVGLKDSADVALTTPFPSAAAIASSGSE